VGGHPRVHKGVAAAHLPLFAEQLRILRVGQEKNLIATEYKTQLKYKEKCGDAGMAFDFDKPTEFHFEAGQYVDLTLINPPECLPGQLVCSDRSAILVSIFIFF
jgi:hypothetical protein